MWISPALAQSQGPTQPTHPIRTTTVGEAEDLKAKLEKQAAAAFDRSDFPAAEATLRELIPLDHENFVPWYNLACALSMQGRTDDAGTMLAQAINRGFIDRAQMLSDPHLRALRDSPAFAPITAGFERTIAAASGRRLELIKAKYRVGEPNSPYRFEFDDTLRLAYVWAFDAKLFAQAREEIARLERWWREEILPADTGAAPLGAASAPPPIVTVLLPTRPDYRAWAQSRFGDLWDRIGGSYSHDEKALVAMDLGSSMRHEFWHVLHWRHMDVLRQRHPLWLMEGLCSLVEDVDVGPAGQMIPRASWRTNMARRIARVGNPTPWAQLFAFDQKRFIGTRPLARYAESRAIFLFLHQKGKLREWYGAYIAAYPEDPTGLAAFARVFGKPAAQVEKDFRAWLRALPEVADEIGRMAANLPVDLDNGDGAGPTVVSDPLMESFFAPGTRTRDDPASRAGDLRKNDVITAVNGKPVRDLYDLARALADLEAGAKVEVAYTRQPRAQHRTTTVTLVPPR